MTERPTYPRSTCCIPGCPRWSRKFPGEWLCGRHWRMVPLRCRRALNKAWARNHDAYLAWAAEETYFRWLAWHKADRLKARLWAHGRRAVILREAGL